MIKIYNKNGVILNTQDKYCAENIEVAIDTTDLTPENIVKGKRILGVDGTAEAGSGGIPEGYIKPEGTISVTENGTVDVTSYASAEINVPIPDGYILPSGNFEITANGDYDISDKESVSVNVAGSGEGDSLWTGVMEGKIKKQDMDYALYNLVVDNPDKYLQGFDTSKVTLMNHMFEYSTMTSFSAFDTSSVTSMKNFCAYCSHLTDVPELNVSKLTAANYLFYFCSSLEKLPNWDFSKVKEFNSAFSKTKITEAVIDTSSATNISAMFEDCNYLKRVEISTMDNITSQYNVSAYCKYCYSLNQFIIRNMTKVPPFYNSSYAYPFRDCYHFTGTFHILYNPEGLQDAGIYVPDEYVDQMKSATGWSMYGDFIYPLSQAPESWEPSDKVFITHMSGMNGDYEYTLKVDDTITPALKYYTMKSNSTFHQCRFNIKNPTSSTLPLKFVVEITDLKNFKWMAFSKLGVTLGDCSAYEYANEEDCVFYVNNNNNSLSEPLTATITYEVPPNTETFFEVPGMATSVTTAFRFYRIYE